MLNFQSIVILFHDKLTFTNTKCKQSKKNSISAEKTQIETLEKGKEFYLVLVKFDMSKRNKLLMTIIQSNPHILVDGLHSLKV